MGFLPKRSRTIGELEEDKERVILEEEIMTKKAEIAEREAVIAQLKKKYGKNWASILGTSKFTDLSTLKSFLVSAKKGMEKQASSGASTPIGRMTSFKGLPRA